MFIMAICCMIFLQKPRWGFYLIQGASPFLPFFGWLGGLFLEPFSSPKGYKHSPLGLQSF
jgi:hypothetical protein